MHLEQKTKIVLSKLVTFTLVALIGCSAAIKQKESNEWLSLFDGKTLKGWTVKIYHHEVGTNFGNTFRAENGLLKVRYDQYKKFNEQFGHIYYDTPFSNFHIKLDYRFSGEFLEDAPEYARLNSGLMFHSQSPYSMPKEQNWPISVEMQFLASLNDGKRRTTGNMCSPGTDIDYQGKPFPQHCLYSSSDTIPANQWVHAELIVIGSKVTQKINGSVVLEYENPRIGSGVVKGFDPKQWQEGKPLTQGFIALQSEGQPIEFKNIRLKPL